MALESASAEAARLECRLESSRHQEAAECTAHTTLAAAYCEAEARRDALLQVMGGGGQRRPSAGKDRCSTPSCMYIKCFVIIIYINSRHFLIEAIILKRAVTKNILLLMQRWEQGLARLQQTGIEHAQCLQVGTEQ